MAVDANSVSVILGAPGQSGSSQQVTAAGLVFTQAAAPAATSPYWNYDGSNLVGNVPTGAGISFTVGGTAKARLDTTGAYVPIGASVPTGVPYFGTDNGANARVNAAAGNVVALATGGTEHARFFGTALNVTTHDVGANPVSLGGQLEASHLAGGSTALTLTRCRIGLGAGTTSSGTAVTASGHDLAGRVGVTINSTGTANQPILLIAWANAFNTPPFVSLTPGNAATAALAVGVRPFVVTTTTGMSIMGNATGITTGASYVWFYSAVIQ